VKRRERKGRGWEGNRWEWRKGKWSGEPLRLLSTRQRSHVLHCVASVNKLGRQVSPGECSVV